MAWTDMTQLTNCYGWFKPESLSSSYANGDPISSWADASGNGRDISQATSANQPLALANAINGYMAADFDGSNDFLSSASYTQSGIVAASFILSVDLNKNYNGIASVVSGSSPTWNSGSVYLDLLAQSDGTLAAHYRSTNFFQVNSRPISSSQLSVSTFVILTVTNNELNTVYKINGNPIAAGAVFGTANIAYPSSGTSYIHIGRVGLSSDALNGQITEAVFYDAVNKDNPDSVWVEGYLADKYAITLPDGHLFKNEPPENAPTTYNPSGGGGGSTFHPLAQ